LSFFTVTSVSDLPTAISAAVAAGGGTILLPSTPLVGIFDFSSYTVPLVFQGTGNGLSGFKHPNNSLCPGATKFDLSTGLQYRSNATVKGGSNQTYQTLTLDGNYQNQTPPAGLNSGSASTYANGFAFDTKSNITFTDVEVKSTGFTGIFGWNCHNIIITRPYIHDTSVDYMGVYWGWAHPLGIYFYNDTTGLDASLTIVDPIIINTGSDNIQFTGSNVNVYGTSLGAALLQNPGYGSSNTRPSDCYVYAAGGAASGHIRCTNLIGIGSTESGFSTNQTDVVFADCVTWDNNDGGFSAFGGGNITFLRCIAAYSGLINWAGPFGTRQDRAGAFWIGPTIGPVYLTNCVAYQGGHYALCKSSVSVGGPWSVTPVVTGCTFYRGTLGYFLDCDFSSGNTLISSPDTFIMPTLPSQVAPMITGWDSSGVVTGLGPPPTIVNTTTTTTPTSTSTTTTAAPGSSTTAAPSTTTPIPTTAAPGTTTANPTTSTTHAPATTTAAPITFALPYFMIQPYQSAATPNSVTLSFYIGGTPGDSFTIWNVDPMGEGPLAFGVLPNILQSVTLTGVSGAWNWDYLKTVSEHGSHLSANSGTYSAQTAAPTTAAPTTTTTTAVSTTTSAPIAPRASVMFSSFSEAGSITTGPPPASTTANPTTTTAAPATSALPITTTTLTPDTTTAAPLQIIEISLGGYVISVPQSIGGALEILTSSGVVAVALGEVGSIEISTSQGVKCLG